MNQYSKIKFSEIAKLRYGKEHKNLKNGAIKAFGSGGVIRFVDSYIYDKESVLIPRKGSLNNIFYSDKPFWVVDTMFYTEINSQKCFPKYLYYYFTTIDFLSLNSSSAIPSLTAQIINEIQIPLPPLKEQEKIARILGVWDSALTTLANLIKAKRKYKTALMQRLLTPPRYTASCHTEGVARSIQKDDLQGNDICLDSSLSTKAQNDKEKNAENSREISSQNDKENTHNDKKKIRESSLRFAGFGDKWQEFRLGDLLKEKNIRNANNVNLVLSVTNKQGFVAQKDYFEQEVASNDTSNYKVVCRGEFAYNPARINVGSIAMLENFENGILSPMYIVFECLEKINKDFFRYWLESHNFRGILGRYLSGSVRETLSFNDMKTMKIFIPTLAEQKKIAQVLSACDKEIETLNLKFECLKAQKRGLMQQLLSGKVRVKI
ncbi:restriction endonuclease subunit S [Helicobacter macacae]|uniref:Type I restriction modification DNA specificity domain-containing protein n=1 Tax=Helicobacter macacae MIT 99-5501 TaxID=1357400 RepID=V8CC79_9HELI|nr:restriction endonuclease subunit S [Helicobacter macacae]ETD25003.1 hypothetical protein HMPREF2086_00338 [Helicobacter macacae MIT 99-5501]